MSKRGKYLMVGLKGIAMGAADVIPGVSGGTIAFMTGIYNELLASISSINKESLKLFFTGKWKQFYRYINGNFLFSLIVGIGISILSLAKLMSYLLVHQPVETWAFFFGLIVASSILILKGIENWKPKDLVFLALGIVIGIVVCTLSPTNTPDGLWFIFISGALAICAMILPGISGSFILLILGKYEYIMTRISELVSGIDVWSNLGIMAVFGLGCIIGIVSFSKFLHWLMEHYHKQTVLVMAGFIIGSLVRIWPWSNMDKVIVSQNPEMIGLEGPALETALANFDGIVNMHYGGAIIFALIGFALIGIIELGSKAIAKRRGSKD